MRLIKGQIHRISRDYRLFSVQVFNRLEFFYLEPRFIKQFRQVLYPGVFIQITVSDERFKYRRRFTNRVVTFEKIIGNRYHRKFSYFDQNVVKQNILDKIAKYNYRLFLDLEMTMQHSKSYTDEIIQAGVILVDQQDKVIFEFDSYIRPTKIKNISRFTLDFLKIKPSKIKQGIDYLTFYQVLQAVVNKYHPAIIVWGTNDNYALEQSYIINNTEPLFAKENYIDMQEVHKQYYNLNYELGLFKTAEIYGIDTGKQEHHAYQDAIITREIFNCFYDYASNNIDFPFKKIFLEKK